MNNCQITAFYKSTCISSESVSVVSEVKLRHCCEELRMRRIKHSSYTMNDYPVIYVDFGECSLTLDTVSGQELSEVEAILNSVGDGFSAVKDQWTREPYNGSTSDNLDVIHVEATTVSPGTPHAPGILNTGAALSMDNMSIRPAIPHTNIPLDWSMGQDAPAYPGNNLSFEPMPMQECTPSENEPLDRSAPVSETLVEELLDRIYRSITKDVCVREYIENAAQGQEGQHQEPRNLENHVGTYAQLGCGVIARHEEQDFAAHNDGVRMTPPVSPSRPTFVDVFGTSDDPVAEPQHMEHLLRVFRNNAQAENQIACPPFSSGNPAESSSSTMTHNARFAEFQRQSDLGCRSPQEQPMDVVHSEVTSTHSHNLEDYVNILQDHYANDNMQQPLSMLSISHGSPTRVSPIKEERNHTDPLCVTSTAFPLPDSPESQNNDHPRYDNPPSIISQDDQFLSDGSCGEVCQDSRKGKGKKFTTRRRRSSIQGKEQVHRAITAPQFLLNLLQSNSNCSVIQWDNKDDGTFRIRDSKRIATMWAEARASSGCKRTSKTYENFSRTVRHHYRTEEIVAVEKRLTYKFGRNGPYSFDQQKDACC